MIKRNRGLPCLSRGSLLLVLMCGIMELPFVQLTASPTASCSILEYNFNVPEEQKKAVKRKYKNNTTMNKNSPLRNTTHTYCTYAQIK